MTQGGQIASMRIRMFSQIANIILYCLFIFFWILVGLVLWVKISWQTFVNGCIYWWCTTLEGMRDLIRSQPVYEIQYYGKTFRMNAAQVLHDKYMIWCGEQLWSAFVLASVVALVICLITFFVVSWILGRQGKQQSENEITGGRQLTDNPKEVARMLKKDGKDSDIRIGDLPIIRDSEIQNFCLHGTVGAGKSEVIRRLANYARQRGDMVVIYDRSGEFVKSYYDPSIDKILNPLDARCAAWDLWKECLTQPDFDNTANTLIPMGTKEDPFWQGSGRTIFAEAAYLMRNDPNRSYSKLVDTLLSIKIEKLRTFLRNSPAANLVEEKIEKTAISIRAVLTNYVKAIRYLQGIEHNGEPFTIRDWMRGVREDQKNGWLFISSNADTHASLKPVISMWLSIAIRGLLAMGENRNRRVWFFCDELTAFSREPEMANRSRQRYWHSGRLKRPSAVKRNAVRMKLSVKWQRTNLTCRTAKQSRLSGILPGWSVTGLPYLNGKPRCRRVYCVNHNGCGKRSGRLPGKICCRSDCSRWSGIWFVTCRKRKPWAETDTGR